jgi:hypothetical protein
MFGLVQLAIKRKLRLEKMLLPSIDYMNISNPSTLFPGLRTDYSISVTYKIQVPHFGSYRPSEKSAVNFEIESVIMTKSFFG